MLCGMLLDNKIIKMNNIINKFLLAGDKCMPENTFKTTSIYL